MSKILIVEDEPTLAASIKHSLERHSFETDVAYDGRVGKSMALSNIYSLIIMDVNLPHENGYEICKTLREKNIQTPVIMLTALSTTGDKLTGFDAGADDYLQKPFEFDELIARINAVLKRSARQHDINHVLKVADLELDIMSKKVKRAGKNIILSAKEFSLLEYLIRNKGIVLSRSDIAEKIWDITFDTGTNVIDVYINMLRNKVDKGYPVQLIKTLRGMGYVLRDE